MPENKFDGVVDIHMAFCPEVDWELYELVGFSSSNMGD
jgi:hypothetical protein